MARRMAVRVMPESEVTEPEVMPGWRLVAVMMVLVMQQSSVAAVVMAAAAAAAYTINYDAEPS